MPVKTSTATAMRAPIPKMPSLRLERRGGMASGMLEGLRRRRLRFALVHKAEDDGNEYQCGDRREEQPADDGAAERRVLLAPLAEAESHRSHADDHRQRGHHDGAKAHEARLERRRDRIAKFGEPLARETDDENDVCGGDDHAHERAG